jgi:RNA polymerase sigma-70 factor (family 1)
VDEKNSKFWQSIVAGDKIAFKTLYDEYNSKVYNTAISYVQNDHDAEEITQEVFTNIFRHASKFKGNSSLNTWIYRIAINSSLNFLKKKKRFSFFHLSLNHQDKPDFEHPGVLAERKEQSKLLFQAIDSLSEQQKTAFILSFVEHLPQQEVATIMELSLKAVESLLQRAKGNLRKNLNKLGIDRRNVVK